MAPAHDEVLAGDTGGLNIVPFAAIAGGWLGPLLMFWLYVWGPLRPFHYPAVTIGPPLGAVVVAIAICVAPWWLPASYYRVRSFERSGPVYEALGVRAFRALVPDGDLANRWRRKREPGYRIVSNRGRAAAFVQRTELGERSHVVLLLFGALSAYVAWRIGWRGWALYLTAGNLVVNVYPILLQRYTRARLTRLLSRSQKPDH